VPVHSDDLPETLHVAFNPVVPLGAMNDLCPTVLEAPEFALLDDRPTRSCRGVYRFIDCPGLARYVAFHLSVSQPRYQTGRQPLYFLLVQLDTVILPGELIAHYLLDLRFHR
jgi:hypothetical protein